MVKDNARIDRIRGWFSFNDDQVNIEAATHESVCRSHRNTLCAPRTKVCDHKS